MVALLEEGLHGRLTLLAAPAGFGKTTLLGEWLTGLEHPAAWLSLDKEDNDPARFLTYMVAALQTVTEGIGEEMSGALQSPQPPSTEAILTTLINELATVEEETVLILDDYHLIDAKPIDDALAFLIDHLPPRMHLLIATREDPQLPLARMRARGQLSELRATDLRFTPDEAAEFLGKVMGLDLSAGDIVALESRTEGWIAGLQLAAISMQGHEDITSFIECFTGSHHFVLDYLVEEVLGQQPESLQVFLLRTSILDRLCGPLCDAVLLDPSVSGQETLETIEHANLFLVPLDNERHWYRYHHLFAELLRQRLQGRIVSSAVNEEQSVAELHARASQWYEENGFEVEAFHHATAANDVERAERLIEGGGMPLQFRGAAAPILSWLASLPTTVLNDRPALWVTYASALLAIGQVTGVEEKAQAAEAALHTLHTAEPNAKTRDLLGRIASVRATVAVTQHQVDTIINQARRALEYLHPDNLPVRASIAWTLGYAHQLRGDRAAASQAYAEALTSCQAVGHAVIAMMSRLGLGRVQESENQLHLAAETYRHTLKSAGDAPPPPICDAYLGLARICYQWNDLDAAERHVYKSLPLARQIENTDRFVGCKVFLSRLKLAQGDVSGSAAILAEAGQLARQHNFVLQIPEIAAAQVLTLLRQGKSAAAAHLAETHELPISRARAQLARGDASSALPALQPLRRQAEAKGWEDERLEVMVLQAVAHHACGERDEAIQVLGDVLALSEPEGYVRIFVDEGRPMARLLYEAAASEIMPGYVDKLLAAFEAEEKKSEPGSYLSPVQSPTEPLSHRELEVLRLIAQGLSNREISQRLFLALSTVKGHNRIIFSKLMVERRTEAVARARELGLL